MNLNLGSGAGFQGNAPEPCRGANSILDAGECSQAAIDGEGFQVIRCCVSVVAVVF